MGSPYNNRVTFLNAYKVLHMSLLPSKTKETMFQILNRTIWTQNMAHKSEHAPDALCYCCEEVEPMEHLLYSREHYSAKIWDLAGKSMTPAISHYSVTTFALWSSFLWRLFLINRTHRFSYMLKMPPPRKS
jgi:hypothetical protein